MKYKAGDKVRIKNGLKVKKMGELNSNYFINAEMADRGGSEAFVVQANLDCYTLSIDGGRFLWTDEMLEQEEMPLGLRIESGGDISKEGIRKVLKDHATRTFHDPETDVIEMLIPVPLATDIVCQYIGIGEKGTMNDLEELKVGDYVRVSEGLEDERYQDVGKVILTLENDHCFVRFEDKEEIPYHNDNLEKLTTHELRPEIKSSLEERAEAEEKPKIGTIEMVFPEEKKQEIIEEIRSAYKEILAQHAVETEPTNPSADPKIVLHKQITEELTAIYEAKNHDYGDSFQETYRKLGLISAVTRITDKVNRIQSLCTKEQRVAEESIRDTLKDCANYCIMTLIALEEDENE
nr:DUF1599 domain-containing protein [uncultured Trichococcus sp.]